MPTDALSRIETALIALVRRTSDPRGNREINRMAGADIERAGAALLARIEEMEPARLTELADAAGVEVSTASRQVARLVDVGYVERSPDPGDRRATAHRLTPAGRDLRRRLAAARRIWLEDVLADFDPDEREQFAELLDRFVQRMIDPRDPAPAAGAADPTSS